MSGGYRADDYNLDDPGPSPLEHANWNVPKLARLPGWALALAMSAVWIFYFPRDGILNWGLSASAIEDGRWETIFLHMFAHASLGHIVLNLSVLVPLAGLLTARLGEPPGSWFRFLLVYILGGLSGAALYLAFHPHGSVPMLGASGAICAIFGLLLRLPSEGYDLVPIRSDPMRLALKHFVKENLVLILILSVPAILIGQGGGVAWEAHLGGLLFGIFLGPLILIGVIRSSTVSPAA